MVKIYINIWCFKTHNIVKILHNGMLQQLLVIGLVTLVRQRLGASVLFNQYFNLCPRFSMIVTTRFFMHRFNDFVYSIFRKVHNRIFNSL